ncbi:MAG TPA: response regulator [Thermoanaerobaculia bacterium]|nr:response regulator [Thermoanaerobaculia bacterium]
MSEKPAVLIVDDNDMMRKLLAIELSSDGRFSVDQAATGEEGLQKAIASGCAVVVLDMILPDMDGLQVIEKLKIARPDNPPSIIAITGAPATLVPDSMIEAPYRGLVSAVFRKPFDHAKLRETVAFCIGA